MAAIELMNICMIYDNETNKVLVQDRIISWCGIAFPGGHVEKGESMVESTIREVKEETGLDVSNLKHCGIINWYNIDTGDSSIIFCYKTDTFEGELIKDTVEGDIFWVDFDELPKKKLAPNFGEQLPMFTQDEFCEAYIHFGEDYEGSFKWF